MWGTHIQSPRDVWVNYFFDRVSLRIWAHKSPDHVEFIVRKFHDTSLLPPSRLPPTARPMSAMIQQSTNGPQHHDGAQRTAKKNNLDLSMGARDTGASWARYDFLNPFFLSPLIDYFQLGYRNGWAWRRATTNYYHHQHLNQEEQRFETQLE